MGNSAIIVTSDEVTNEDLMEFCAVLGGWRQSESTIALSEGDAYIWVSLQPDSAYQNIVSEEDRQHWRTMLKGAPRYVVEIALNHDKNAHKLCLNFACRFAKKWNAILSDIDDEVLSRDQLISKKYGKPWERSVPYE